MVYFLAGVAAIAGFLFGYDEGVIAVAEPLLAKDYPMSPGVRGFMTAAVPLGALIAAISAPSGTAAVMKPRTAGDIGKSLASSGSATAMTPSS